MMEVKIQETGIMFATSIGGGFKFLDFTVINRSIEGIVHNPNLAYLGIFNQKDKLISSYNPRELELNLPTMIHNENISTLEEISFFATPINFENEKYGNLIIGYSLEEMHQKILSNTIQGLLICLAILILGTFLIVFLSQVLTSNIVKLKDAAKSFVLGEKYRSISIDSKDEVGELASVFNNLIDEVNLGVKNIEKKSDDLEKKNQELGDFINIASHDFNEPVSDIANIRDLLKGSLSKAIPEFSDQESAKYLDTMQKPLKRIRYLISDLLKYSSLMAEGDYKFQSVQLEDIVQQAILDLELQIRKFEGKVEVETLPKIESHPFHMKQVFLNLIGNSLKFHKKETPPIISIKSEAFNYENGNSGCRISIKDNGIGFDQKNMEDAFKPLVRLIRKSEFEGTGMGLSICKRIIERHGGTIVAESCLGKGTTFNITLPTKQN